MNCLKIIIDFSRNIMRAMLVQLDCPDEGGLLASVRVLVQLCRRQEMGPVWLDFLDLILLKLIDKYCKMSKEVRNHFRILLYICI